MPTKPGNTSKVTRLSVKVKPNSRSSKLEVGESDEPWTAWLKSPPVDGKANQELITLVARHFGCQKAGVQIKHGQNSRIKLLEITTQP
jgi:uncharacterized protein (TIGR00251 family)